VSVASRDCWLV